MSHQKSVTKLPNTPVLISVSTTALLALGVAIAMRKTRHTLPSYRFHSGYNELVRLRNGERVLIRPLQPNDRFRIAAEMGRLSEQSRYLRFHRPKTELTPEELQYLTRIDGVNHFALVAGDVRGKGLGVARYVRYSERPTVANMAIVVVDRMQGQGLGRALVQRLIEAAGERGITLLQCEVLPNNRAALHLLKSIAPSARQWWEDGTYMIEIPTKAPAA